MNMAPMVFSKLPMADLLLEEVLYLMMLMYQETTAVLFMVIAGSLNWLSEKEPVLVHRETIFFPFSLIPYKPASTLLLQFHPMKFPFAFMTCRAK